MNRKISVDFNFQKLKSERYVCSATCKPLKGLDLMKQLHLINEQAQLQVRNNSYIEHY